MDETCTSSSAEMLSTLVSTAKQPVSLSASSPSAAERLPLELVERIAKDVRDLIVDSPDLNADDERACRKTMLELSFVCRRWRPPFLNQNLRTVEIRMHGRDGVLERLSTTLGGPLLNLGGFDGLAPSVEHLVVVHDVSGGMPRIPVLSIIWRSCQNLRRVDLSGIGAVDWFYGWRAGCPTASRGINDLLRMFKQMGQLASLRNLRLVIGRYCGMTHSGRVPTSPSELLRLERLDVVAPYQHGGLPILSLHTALVLNALTVLHLDVETVTEDAADFLRERETTSLQYLAIAVADDRSMEDAMIELVPLLPQLSSLQYFLLQQHHTRFASCITPSSSDAIAFLHSLPAALVGVTVDIDLACDEVAWEALKAFLDNRLRRPLKHFSCLDLSYVEQVPGFLHRITWLKTADEGATPAWTGWEVDEPERLRLDRVQAGSVVW
ncbi:hypothetical protein JCM10450v2_003288 [Rhodotorula kratochvilovae]